MWIFFLAWLSLTWSAFLYRETDKGIRLTFFEEQLRYGLIAVIFILAVMAFMGKGPIQTPEGTHWYPAKLLLYGITLCIGLFLRVVMRRWTLYFRELAAGPNAAVQAKLDKEIAQARIAAYIYWITISGICFLGATKPF
jgi:hypothetical protein